jgi:hypothetical protein
MAPSQTCSGPMPSAGTVPATCETMVLDSHTIPIMFGTIGVILASLSLIVNIAFGILQVRAINKRTSGDLERGNDGSPQPAVAGSIPQPVDVTNQQPRLHEVVHELDASKALLCVNLWSRPVFVRTSANVPCIKVHPTPRNICPNHLHKHITYHLSLLRLRLLLLLLVTRITAAVLWLDALSYALRSLSLRASTQVPNELVL